MLLDNHSQSETALGKHAYCIDHLSCITNHQRWGRNIYLLGEGRLINLSAAEGHPSSVMYMSFANQALCIEHLAGLVDKLQPNVYNVPTQIDKDVAKLKLESMGIYIDTLTDEQKRYLESWEEGT